MSLRSDTAASGDVAKLAFRFVLIIGVVNFFADMTYEGARSIVGPFLGSLGASAAVVGFVAGFGEMVGYGLRSVSGYFADKTHKYWAVAFLGYAINMLSVPALALAGNWPLAAALVVAERTGRAIRRPAVESMLSRAGQSIGQGWVFGLNEAMDQTGATLGPLITAWVLYRRGGYHHAFAVLLISALLCLTVLFVAWSLYRRPHELETQSARPLTRKGLSESVLALCGSGSVDRCRVRRLFLDRVSFPETCNCSAGTCPGLLCGRHGNGRYRVPRIWKIAGQTGHADSFRSIWYFCLLRAVGFSRRNQAGTHRHDFVGHGDGRAGLLPESCAIRGYSLRGARHGLRDF